MLNRQTICVAINPVLEYNHLFAATCLSYTED